MTVVLGRPMHHVKTITFLLGALNAIPTMMEIKHIPLPVLLVIPIFGIRFTKRAPSVLVLS